MGVKEEMMEAAWRIVDAHEQSRCWIYYLIADCKRVSKEQAEARNRGA